MIIPYVICATVIVAASVGFFFSGTYYFSDDGDYFHVIVNPKKILCEIDEKFLSIALDSSFMRHSFHNFTDGDWEKLEELSRFFSPAYLRVGGTDADRTVFNVKTNLSAVDRDILNATLYEDLAPHEEIIITGEDWLKLNEFVRKSKLNLIIDLNVLLRKNSHWDDSNAKALVRFSEENGLSLDFQLGNEPNSFPHVFNTTITGGQLGSDFRDLRKLLNSTETYRKSKLIGPDVTRPKNLGRPSLKFLEEFLSSGDVVDVVSWHQYYLNGRTASLEDFINPDTFNVLPHQIESVLKTVRRYFENKPVWISETSTACGGGAPQLSDRFVGSFLWVDKLGLAARMNISAVVRQSLFGNYYSLFAHDFSPNPDFWISVLYKHLVGTRVLDVNVKSSSPSSFFRCYGHCVASNASVNGSVVLYGFNLTNRTELFIPSGMSIVYPVYSFIFTPELNNLTTKTLYLNDHRLAYKPTLLEDMLQMAKAVEYPLTLPPYSIGFWIVMEITETACKR